MDTFSSQKLHNFLIFFSPDLINCNKGIAALMADIEDSKIEIVVVYKINRWTRNLPDFSNLVEVLSATTCRLCPSPTVQHDDLYGKVDLNILLSLGAVESARLRGSAVNGMHEGDS
jgi:DNA invertase Pin-like site-specific DNA recombinase